LSVGSKFKNGGRVKFLIAKEVLEHLQSLENDLQHQYASIETNCVRLNHPTKKGKEK
jgi:hypothetical protein